MLLKSTALWLTASSDPYNSIHISYNITCIHTYANMHTHTHTGCHVFEGDICVSDKQWEHLNHRIVPTLSHGSPDSLAHGRVQRAVVKMELLKWFDGVVPYVLNDDLSELIPLIS